jgi:hypothetical protein
MLNFNRSNRDNEHDEIGKVARLQRQIKGYIPTKISNHDNPIGGGKNVRSADQKYANFKYAQLIINRQNVKR